jgi:hypothetical protein
MMNCLLCIPRRLSIKGRRFGTLCLFHLQQVVKLKMEPTQCSETSAVNTQTPGEYPEDNSSYIYKLYSGLITAFSSMPDSWLLVSIRKVLRPAISTQVFLGSPPVEDGTDRVPKRRLLILRRRGNTQNTIYHYCTTAKA